MTTGRKIAAAALGALVATAAPALAQAPADVTFARDVAPILQRSCQGCHRTGSMAPMSLVTYQEVRPWARSIREKVANRVMPPWHIDKTVGVREFANDISLSDAEIDAVVRWVDAGAPLGDPADMPPPIDWPAGDIWRLADKYAELGEPDIVVRSTPWTQAAAGQDQWYQPIVETGLTEDRWVRALEVRPSLPGRPIVHHAV
ncbi:MAG: cytochrome c, partial [Acidobacteria bacterium]|nr:cytochrome c [Acidobacteriota bacterium]